MQFTNITYYNTGTNNQVFANFVPSQPPPPQPSISVGDTSVTEGTPQNPGVATFTLTLSAPCSQSVSVTYLTSNGTAQGNADYQSVSNTATFAPGQTTQVVSVPLVYDPVYGGSTETFFLNLVNPVNGVLARVQATCTITESVPPPSIAVNSVTVTSSTTSNEPATFTISVSGPSRLPVTVNYSTANGTATAGTNYTAASGTLTLGAYQLSQTLTINVNAEPYWLPSETFDLNLSNPSGGTIARSQGVATINSGMPTPTISVSNVTVTNVASGTTQAAFTISLSEPLGVATSVAYATADGTAIVNRDYQRTTGLLNFAPGQTSQNVTVNVIGDPYYENPRMFYLELVPLAGGAPYASGTGTIVSGLSEPTLSVTNAIVTDSTSGTVPMTFVVNLSAASSDPVTVNYSTADGTAVAGTNYQATSGTLTFQPGQTFQTITVEAIGSAIYSPTLNYSVNLSSASGAAISQGQGTGSIVSSEFPLGVSIGGVYVTDVLSGTKAANFWVWLSAASTVPVTVNFNTVDGTAIAGTDYVATSGTLTFAPGQTGQFLPVNVIGNPTDEPSRTFSVVLSSPVNAEIGNQGGFGTIFSDVPSAAIGPNTIANEGSTVQFDSGGSDPNGYPLTFTWNFGDGAAGAGQEPTHVYEVPGVYTATVTVSNGSTSGTASEVVTVLAVGPTASVSGPSAAVPGQLLTFTLSATSPSSFEEASPFTYQVNWGDGSTQTVQGSGSGIQVTHAFAGAGSYSVSVTATDASAATGPATTQSVTITAVLIEGSDLYVGGTTGNDTIMVQPADTNGTIDVNLNGQDLGHFVPTGQIVMYGVAGNDLLQVDPLYINNVATPVALPVIMFGGIGNDTLDAFGASGPTVLVGGSGINILRGGSGPNILIGGSTTSALYGNTGDNLMIAGTTSFDDNLAALEALRAEWARTDVDYLTKIADLSGPQSGGLNGNYFLNSQTVTSNGAGNDLFAGPGQDWLWAASNDDIYNLQLGDVVTSL